MTLDTLLSSKSFLTDSLLCTPDKVHSNVFGVAGDPIPLSIGNDNWITITLMGCFVLMVVMTARSREFILQQLSNFFFRSHKDDLYNETSEQIWFQVLFVFIDCVLLGIGTYLLTTSYITADFIVGNTFLLSMLFALMFLIYFFLKWSFQSFVNVVFWGSKKNGQWIKVQLYVTAWSSVLTFPVILLQVYFQSDIEISVYYLIFVLFLNKSLTFYKQWQIFFTRNGFFLQFFLYFCALEITPLVALGGFWLMMVDNLKINF